MVDPPPDEVAALLEGGPDDFVASRTARARALRTAGRRAEATALAAVRKPLRLTWVLIDVQRARPELVVAAVEAAEALAVAQSGGGGRVRALVAALRTALDDVTEAATEVAPGSDGAQAGLLARQVVGDPDARRAWVEGRLLAPPEPDTEGGRAASTPSPAPPSRPSGARPRTRLRSVAPTEPEADHDAPPERGPDDAARLRAVAEAEEAEGRARREAEARAVAEERLRAARTAQDEAAEALERLQAEEHTVEAELEELGARRDQVRADLDRARGELARTEAEVAEAEAEAEVEAGER